MDKSSKNSMKIDDIIRTIRPFGYYQMILCFLYMYNSCLTIQNNGFMAYGGLEPKWTCNGHGEPSKNCTVYSACTEENITYTYEFYSIIPQWGLVCEKAYFVELITTCQMCGVLVGALISGHLSDHFGRKYTYIGLMLIELVVSGCSVLAKSWATFAVFRFFIGLTCGGEMVAAWVYNAEFTRNKERFLFRAIAVCQVFDIGAQTVLTYLTQRWKAYTIASNIFGVPLLIMLFFIYESPRWLIQKGRSDEALKIIWKVAKINRTSDRLPGNLTIDLNKIESGENGETKKYFLWDLFKTCQLTTYTAVSVFLWFAVAVIYYGMYFDLGNLGGNVYMSTFILAIAGVLELPVAFLDYFWSKIDRRIILLIGLGIAIVANLLIAVFMLKGTVNHVKIILSVISVVGQDSNNMAFDMAYLYSVELFPTLLRSLSSSLCSVGARIGTMVAPNILYLKDHWTPFPYFIFAGIGLVAWLLVFFLLPNTKKVALPETFGDTRNLGKSELKNRHSEDCGEELGRDSVKVLELYEKL